jgi:hypothetical protein
MDNILDAKNVQCNQLYTFCHPEQIQYLQLIQNNLKNDHYMFQFSIINFVFD